MYLKINDFEFETKGFLDKNIINFSYNKTKYIFNIDKLMLIKEDNDSILKFNFKEKILYLHDKLLKKEFNLKILIKNLQIFKNDIIISYQIEEEIFSLLISFKEE
ncbi:MAG: hypothetical protein PUC23_00850 [bacterium]|nr:hypothetical protein [bacterium]